MTRAWTIKHEFKPSSFMSMRFKPIPTKSLSDARAVNLGVLFIDPNFFECIAFLSIQFYRYYIRCDMIRCVYPHHFHHNL